jgi:hypothetical protein
LVPSQVRTRDLNNFMARMEEHRQWRHDAACACARHHLVSVVEHLLDSMTVSLTGALQQTEEIVRSYLSNNSVRINDTNAMIALAHASWTGMKLFSNSTTGNIIDKLIVPPSDWKWDEVIDGWSYEEELAPTTNLRARTVRGPLYSNRVTALKGSPEVNWKDVQFTPVAVIGHKAGRPGTNEASNSLWKTTWADDLRPGDEAVQWQRDANNLDVHRLVFVPGGGLLVQYFWTWQRDMTALVQYFTR